MMVSKMEKEKQAFAERFKLRLAEEVNWFDPLGYDKVCEVVDEFAEEVADIKNALNRIANPIKWLQRDAE